MKRKRNLTMIICSLVFFVSVLILSQDVLADAGAREDAVNWAYAQQGKSLDYDGAYGAQCVDLIKYYYAYFGKASYAKGNGCDYVSNALPDGWTRIKNTADFVPEPGDIAVWGTELSKHGHVAIILSANTSSFVSMDQNWPSGSPCKQVTHTYSKFWGVIRPNFTSSGDGSTSHVVNNSYSGFTPFKAYANSTGKINVYNAGGTQYSNRYISGSSDLCTINEVYTDGWCKVTYPSSAEASGYFTAYAKLSEFIPNASPSVATATSGGTAYRRSSGSDSIGSISSGDRCLKVSSANGRIEAIYPVDGQSYSKAGWVAESVFSGSNQGGSAVSSGAYKVPCKAYAISSGKVTVYNASHAAYSISSHYIDGANDLCTINSIGNDGWCQVSYPTSSGSFTAYVPLSTFIPGSASPQNWTASAKYTAYRRSSGSNTIGSVSSGDACIKVASENGRTQVMYPVSGQNYYKMGWIDGDTGHNPKGVIDGMTGGIYSIRMSGWAFDEDNLGAALGIHVYIGDTCIGTGVADHERTDVHNVYGCGNYHGYELDFNLDKKYAGEQTVRVYAINVGGGTNAYLGEKKVTIGSDTEAPVISDYKVTNVTSSGYTVSCTVTDNTGVDRVQFPTWTSYNGQDDIFAEWQINPGASGQKNGNTYTYQVNISAHNYEAEKYNTHIYAYDKYGNASCVGVSVIVPVDVEDIVLNQESMTFEAAGEEQTLKASVYPENATDKTVKWSSANSAVATVNNGVVKAVGAGETTITATTGNGKKAECTVKVNEKKLTGISIASKPEKVEYYTGDSLDTKGMALIVTYSDGSSQKIQDGFTCTPTVLNTAGTQKITVSYEGKTAVFYVTVKEQPTGAFSVENVSGTQGETVQAVIKMDQNPGIIAARLKVNYDAEAMTLTKVEDGGILGEHTFGNNLKANPYTMLWENGTVSSNLTGTGTLVVLTFQIAESASEGAHDVTLSYDPDEVYDVDLRNVKFTVSNGTVTVKKADAVVQQGSCGTNVTWTLNKDGVLTISGNGEMKNYTYKSEMPWYRYNSQIKTVKIESGVTSIGDYAFYGMPAMKEIVIPDGVKTIGAYAFKNCTALESITIQNKETEIDIKAFKDCPKLSIYGYAGSSAEAYAKKYSIPFITLKLVTEGWKKDAKGWWYQNSDGSYPKNQWKKIGKEWYHFDTNGYMQTGWLKLDSFWYYLKDTGAMAKDEWVDNGKSYVDADGKYVPGKVKYTEGWKKDAKGWWYQNSDGSYPKNQWKKIKGDWYHFDTSGYMQTGWLKIDNIWYYFKTSGAMAKDEWVDNGKSYVDADGKYVPGKKKYTEGWKKNAKGWWYQEKDGSYPKSKWKQISGKWYYFDANGYMQTGWLKLGNIWYYLKASGAMAENEWVENGKYFVDANGKYIAGKKA